MTDLEAFARLIKRLRKEPSRKRKRWLVKQALEINVGLVRYFHAAFQREPYPVTSADALEVKDRVRARLTSYAVRSPFELLASRNFDAEAWAACVLRQPCDVRGVLCCILDRDLKCGLDLETLNMALEDCDLSRVPGVIVSC